MPRQAGACLSSQTLGRKKKRFASSTVLKLEPKRDPHNAHLPYQILEIRRWLPSCHHCGSLAAAIPSFCVRRLRY
jgi:hypothetical protein